MAVASAICDDVFFVALLDQTSSLAADLEKPLKEDVNIDLRCAKIEILFSSKLFDYYSSEGVRRKGRMSSTTDRYRAGILDGHRDRQNQEVTVSDTQSQRVMDLTKKGPGGKWEQVM